MLVALTIKIKKGKILKRGGENTARTKLNGDVSLNVFGLKTRGNIYRGVKNEIGHKKTTRFAGGFNLVISA